MCVCARTTIEAHAQTEARTKLPRLAHRQSCHNSQLLIREAESRTRTLRNSYRPRARRQTNPQTHRRAWFGRKNYRIRPPKREAHSELKRKKKKNFGKTPIQRVGNIATFSLEAQSSFPSNSLLSNRHLKKDDPLLEFGVPGRLISRSRDVTKRIVAPARRCPRRVRYA